MRNTSTDAVPPQSGVTTSYTLLNKPRVAPEVQIDLMKLAKDFRG